MILFLYGEESYLLQEKLQQIIARAREQGIDATNTADLDAVETEPNTLSQHLQAAPFLAPKRLVIIRNWLTQKSADEGSALAELLASVPETTIAVIVESGKPDKRRSGFKEITKIASKSWEYAPVEASAAARQAVAMASAQGSQMTAAVAAELVERVGADLQALATEIAKLSIAHSQITEQTLDDLVVPNVEGNIFTLVDALGQRRLPTAMQELHALLEAEEPPLRILAMMIRQFRLLLSVQAIGERKLSDAEIAKAIAVPPWLVSKLKYQADSFAPTELRQIYQQLATLDEKLKMSPPSPEALLQLFMAEVCLGHQTANQSKS